MSWLVLAWSLAGTAHASCVAPTDAELQAWIDAGRDALFAEDLDALARVDGELAAAAPCLDRGVSPELMARHLVTLAIAAYADNGDWQSPLESALAADPAVDRAVGATHPIASWRPPGLAPTVEARAPTGVAAYLDGRQVQYLAQLRGPHLIQVQDGGTWRSAYVPEAGPGAWDAVLTAAEAPQVAEAPAADPAPTSPPRERHPKRLVVVGAGTAAVGGALAGATWWRAGKGVSSWTQWDALVGANVGGWALVGVGAGLATWGGVSLVVSDDLSVGVSPGAVRLQGAF